MRGKLEHVWETTGRKPDELNIPDFPDAAADAFSSWLDLNAGRTSNGMGASPFSWLDLDAWCRIRKRIPLKTELDLIRTIDRAFLQAQTKEK